MTRRMCSGSERHGDWAWTMSLRTFFRYLYPWSAGNFLLFVACRFKWLNLEWMSLNAYTALISVPFFVPWIVYRLGPVRRMRKRSLREKFCMYCGYSHKGLEASKGSRCPECGESIEESLRLLEEYRSAGWFYRQLY